MNILHRRATNPDKSRVVRRGAVPRVHAGSQSRTGFWIPEWTVAREGYGSELCDIFHSRPPGTGGGTGRNVRLLETHSLLRYLKEVIRRWPTGDHISPPTSIEKLSQCVLLGLLRDLSIHLPAKKKNARRARPLILQLEFCALVHLRDNLLHMVCAEIIVHWFYQSHLLPGFPRVFCMGVTFPPH